MVCDLLCVWFWYLLVLILVLCGAVFRFLGVLMFAMVWHFVVGVWLVLHFRWLLCDVFVISLIGFRMMVWVKFRGLLGGRFMVVCGVARFGSILISWFASVVLWVVICLWFVREFAVVLGGGCDFLRFWVL